MGRKSARARQLAAARAQVRSPGRPQGSREVLPNPPANVLNQQVRPREECLGCASHSTTRGVPPQKRRKREQCNSLDIRTTTTVVAEGVVPDRIIRAIAEGCYCQGVAHGQQAAKKKRRRVALGKRLARLARHISFSPRHFRRLLQRARTCSLGAWARGAGRR
jgi:hypothetical protein